MTTATGRTRNQPVAGLGYPGQNGDNRAWDALVKRYAPLIWSICRRHQLDRADAEDVGQYVWLNLAKPKLRPVGYGFPDLTCGFAARAAGCSGYFKVSGMGAPMRWNASRWVLVGSASMGRAAGAPAKRTWLRVRVPRWARRPRKLR
jgi:hypothetical protein